MATSFNCLPREIFGLTDEDDLWLALQVDRATMRFGKFIQNRIDEQHEVPAQKRSKRNTELKAKYTPDQIHAMIYDRLLSPDELSSKKLEAQAVRSGQVDPYQIEAEEDYIPPSWRGKKVEYQPTTD
jgi:hypothetical protein